MFQITEKSYALEQAEGCSLDATWVIFFLQSYNNYPITKSSLK